MFEFPNLLGSLMSEVGPCSQVPRSAFLSAGRKKFERRSVPLFSNLFRRAPGKQNDAEPQGAMGVFPGAVTEQETGLNWGET